MLHLAHQVGCEVKTIDGSGFTDEVIKGLLMSLVEVPDTPGAAVGMLPVEWAEAGE